jgi:hypothetical protein
VPGHHSQALLTAAPASPRRWGRFVWHPASWRGGRRGVSAYPNCAPACEYVAERPLSARGHDPDQPRLARFDHWAVCQVTGLFGFEGHALPHSWAAASIRISRRQESVSVFELRHRLQLVLGRVVDGVIGIPLPVGLPILRRRRRGARGSRQCGPCHRRSSPDGSWWTSWCFPWSTAAVRSTTLAFRSRRRRSAPPCRGSRQRPG